MHSETVPLFHSSQTQNKKYSFQSSQLPGQSTDGGGDDDDDSRFSFLCPLCVAFRCLSRLVARRRADVTEIRVLHLSFLFFGVFVGCFSVWSTRRRKQKFAFLIFAFFMCFFLFFCSRLVLHRRE